MRWALWVSAVALVFVVAPILRHKLGRPPGKPPDIVVPDPLDSGSLTGVPDAAFFHYLGNFWPAEIRQPWFKRWAESAAWRIPWVGIPFTPVLSCEPGYSVLMHRFDWQVVPQSAWMETTALRTVKNPRLVGCGPVDGRPWRNDTTTKADPRTVWAAAHGVERLLQLAEERLEPGRADRVVVFSGTEVPLSRAFGRTPVERHRTIARLRRYFGRIVYQIKDIELEHVSLAPMGLCWGYLLITISGFIEGAGGRRQNIGRGFLGMEDILGGNLSLKTRGVLATGGVVATWLEGAQIQKNVRWYRRQGVLYPPSNSSLETVSDAAESRRQMREWANSPLARAAGVDFRIVETRDWWTELASYRFLASPMGSAIQTAKTVEALLVLTVPIIQRMNYAAHDELVSMGFPIVLVESWPEVTAEAQERWWSSLSPRLEGFRRNCLTVDGFWRMFTGQVRFCT